MMRFKKICKARKGFTLIEVIIALVIVVIVSVAALAAFTLMNNMTTKTKDLTDDIAALEAMIASGESLDGDILSADNTLSFQIDGINDKNFNIAVNNEEYSLPLSKSQRKFHLLIPLPSDSTD
jgi:prepilin-type N-terminal cleavage/methylation domain-containing protein